jgi:hypothetical protein
MPILRAAAYLVLKAERAQAHLDAFKRQADIFLKEPYTIVREDDVHKGRHIKRYEFKAFSTDLGMLLGEFLYCLRSGLDQMAWQMALPSARRDWPRDICFPIYEDLAKDRRRNYTSTLQLFSAEVAREIDALQPHNGPNAPENHPLWQLNKLCNLDKHCLIPIHSRGAPVYYPHIPGALVYPVESKDAIEVSVPIERKAELDFEPENTSEIQIGDWNSDWALPLHRLSDIHGFITCSVIPTFLRFNLAALLDEKVRVDSVITVYGKRKP